MTAHPFFENPPPDLDLSENRTKTNNAIGIALFVLAVIAVTLRTISRLYFQKVKLGPDDYFMYGAMVCYQWDLATLSRQWLIDRYSSWALATLLVALAVSLSQTNNGDRQNNERVTDLSLKVDSLVLENISGL